MFKQYKKQIVISTLLTLLPAFLWIIFYTFLSKRIVAVWEGTKTLGMSFPSAFMVILPVILSIINLICILFTLREYNHRKSGKSFSIIFSIIPFLSIFLSIMLYSAESLRFDFLPKIFTLFIGLLFLIIGNYMPKITQNRVLGIKIKWTLESEENWNATHRFAGKVWVAGGFLLLFTSLLPEESAIFAFIILLFALIIIPVIYSGVLYKKEPPENRIPLSKTKNAFSKKTVIATIIITLALLVPIMFIGEVEIEYKDSSFVVDCTWWNALEIEYDAIEKIELRESFSKGIKYSGFNSTKILAGSFKNSEFGVYTLYSYAKTSTAVIIEIDEKRLVINGKDAAETKKIYENILKRLP